MHWRIVEYETIRGQKPITEFIKRQQPTAIAKIVHLVDLLEIHGSLLSMPHAKRLGSDLYELRIRGKEEIRIIYGFKGKIIYLLHGFKKKTQKIPVKELNIAKYRFWALK